MARVIATWTEINAGLWPAPNPAPLDGWLCPRRSRVVLVERSRGFLHLWIGPFGLHLARPLHRSRLDFCADWWR